MREYLLEVLQLQPYWSAKNTNAMHRRGLLIRHTLPDQLRRTLPDLKDAIGRNGGDLAVEGKDGTGQKTEVPWVRVYSKSHSRRPTNGWYCVWLFAADGSGFYLALAHGSTKFEGGEFKTRPVEELGRLVSWGRSVIADLIYGWDDVLSTINLKNRGYLGYSYAKSTILAMWYPIDDIPSDAVLVRDLQRFCRLLGEIYDAEDFGRSPESDYHSAQAVQALVSGNSEDDTSRQGSQGFGLSARERRVVEQYAMKLARDYLLSLGYRVKNTSAKFPYDYVATKGDEKYVCEVKGSTGSAENIIITRNELLTHTRMYPHNILILVHSIHLDDGRTGPVASGGRLEYYCPWQVRENDLTPLSYQCAVRSL